MATSPKIMHETPKLKLVAQFCGYYQAAQGVDFPLHEHDSWEFVYYLDGTVECVQEHEHFLAGPGLLWLTPPHTKHAEIARSAYRNMFLLIQAPPGMNWPQQVQDDGRGRLGEVLHSILEELQSKAGADQVLIDLLLQELVHRVGRATRSGAVVSFASEQVRRAEAQFQRTLNEPLNLAELARNIGMSPSGLRAAFHRVHGQSPRDRLRELRCQQALHWLRHSTLTLETIASLCGFDSASHLSRVIYRHCGKRPGQLRESITYLPLRTE